MTKTNKILISLALAQLIAIGGMTFLGGSSEAAAFEATALIDMKPADITRLTIEDDESKTLALSKTADGWVVNSAENYPADMARIISTATAPGGSGLLNKLADLTVDRPTIRRPENHVPLKVAPENFERRVTLEDSNGNKSIVYVSAGARPQTVHVRRDGDDHVFEVTDLSTWDLSTSLSSWIDTTYQTIERDGIVGIAAELADGTSFRIVRREVESEVKEKDPNNPDETTPEPDPIQYKWWFTVPTQDEATQTEVDTLLGKLSALRLKDVHGKNAPEGAVAATWTVTMADGGNVTLTLGGTTSEDAEDRHAKSSLSDFHAILASWDASPLLTVDLEKLRVVKEETPAPVKDETPPKKK